MATDKLFKVCGTSTLDGEMKVRFANDVMRVKVLAKHGHEDITMIELDEPMLKMDAAKLIQDLPEFQGANEQAAIADYIERNTEIERPATKEKPVKAKKTKTLKPTTVKATVPEADELTAAEAIVDELQSA